MDEREKFSPRKRKQGRKCTFSVEIFPPKSEAGWSVLEQTLLKIQQNQGMTPDFFSVTYGAGGSERGKQTFSLCGRIQRNLGVPAVAHLTCINQSEASIGEALDFCRAEAIDTVMVLRGDLPGSGPHPVITPGAPCGGKFRYAIDLVRELSRGKEFQLGVAGYPEGHVEASSPALDFRFQLEKYRAGADFILTQFFLENGHFLRWRDALKAEGVLLPCHAGILPVVSLSQLERFTAMCGVATPPALLESLRRHQHEPEAMKALGLEHALRQINDLLAEGVEGIHLYALNRYPPQQAVASLLDS